MVLEAVYEEDFLSCSYGFRPGRSAHGALASLREQTMSMCGGQVVDVDLRKFFDTVDHGQLRSILGKRVRDGVLMRLIGKWLKAGVMEAGEVSYPERGTPQGGVISPILANIYLHTVLDVWFEQDVRPRLRGAAFLLRYADDLVMMFAEERDAQRVFEVLPQRVEKYGLKLHPEKTRMVWFGRPPKYGKVSRRPGTFDFLGFTHYWGKSRQGNRVVVRKTASERFGRARHRAFEWCKKNRHRPLVEQHAGLVQKLQGHYAYYGITGNAQALDRFYYEVRWIWRYWLARRSRKAKKSWAWFYRLLERCPLPPPVVSQSIFGHAANH
jgi:group II intron reverse transcriptase/maturase